MQMNTLNHSTTINKHDGQVLETSRGHTHHTQHGKNNGTFCVKFRLFSLKYLILDHSEGRLSDSETALTAWKIVQDFYHANCDLLSSRPGSQNINNNNIDESMNNYKEIAQVTVKGLQVLAHLHPFVGGE